MLNPDFVSNPGRTIEDIINKNVRDLEAREEICGDELLFAIEFKYVISSSGVYESEIRKDNKKLEFALGKGACNAVNLVFCNNNPEYMHRFQAAVAQAPLPVSAIFIQSYYDGSEKRTPKPLANEGSPALCKLRGARILA